MRDQVKVYIKWGGVEVISAQAELLQNRDNPNIVHIRGIFDYKVEFFDHPMRVAFWASKDFKTFTRAGEFFHKANGSKISKRALRSMGFNYGEQLI